MIEEPYRWLEAVENRREYVREQLKGGSPAFAARTDEGILLLAVGTGNSKVFELFDRHAMAALGHPADIEKIRQAAIDAAHTEAFTRAPEDVSLRRLVSFGISPQLKTNFEQIFNAPFLIELLMAELGNAPANDTIMRLHYDGSFEFRNEAIVVAASDSDKEKAAQEWLTGKITAEMPRNQIIETLLQAWWVISENKTFTDADAASVDWRAAVKERDRKIEVGLLARNGQRAAKYLAVV